MKPSIKIAFFDIDGTLIDMKKKRMSEKTIEILHRLKEQNILLCIATGRSPITMPVFSDIEFDAFLTFNGSYCFDKNKTIFSNPIPKEDVRKIIENATSIDRPISIASKDRMIANGCDKDLSDYYAITNETVNVSTEFETLCGEDIYQLMLGCQKEEYPALLQGVSHAKITAWWDRAADIIPADGGKGKAVEKVLAYYGLEKEEAIAFGDGNNDIELLQAVGLGVAMGNASEELKAVADDICETVANDGIYTYCMKKGLV